MNQNHENPVSIAISVESIQTEAQFSPEWGHLKSALIHGRSIVDGASFKRYTGPLHPEMISRCERLKQHGFTVVGAPKDWRHVRSSDGSWETVVILQALKQVEGLQEPNTKVAYDEKFASSVLEILNRAFPNSTKLIDLKRELRPEPSDSALLTALEALVLEKYADGVPIRGDGGLDALGNIRITSEGRKHVSGQSAGKVAQETVFHGDQIINYGQAGALGRNASGTVNIYQQQWKQIEKATDLAEVAAQLEQLRTELQKTATTRSDFQQIGLVAEAEEHAEKREGSKLLQVLSKCGANLIPLATKIGAEAVVKLAEHHWSL